MPARPSDVPGGTITRALLVSQKLERLTRRALVPRASVTAP